MQSCTQSRGESAHCDIICFSWLDNTTYPKDLEIVKRCKPLSLFVNRHRALNRVWHWCRLTNYTYGSFPLREIMQCADLHVSRLLDRGTLLQPNFDLG